MKTLALLTCLALAPPPAAPALAPAPVRASNPGDRAGELLAEVRSRKDLTRPEVFEELAALGTPAGLEALQAATRELGSPAAIERAYRAFARLGGGPELRRSAAAFLAREATYGYARKQESAARALARYGTDALDELEQLVAEHEDETVRAALVVGLAPELARRGRPEDLDTLLANFLPPESRPPALFLETVSAFDHEAGLERLARFLRSRRSPTSVKRLVYAALADFRTPGTGEVLLGGLRARDVSCQRAALRGLAGFPAVDLTREVPRLRRSADPGLRREAWLWEFRAEADEARRAERVREAAGARDFALRQAAALVLGEARVPAAEARAGLTRLFADPDWVVVLAALESAARVRDAGLAPALIGALGRGHLRIRRAAREALVAYYGEDHGDSAERWRAAWEAELSGRGLQPAAEARAASATRGTAEELSPTRASFYGLTFESNRVLFLLDVSGSMDQPVASGEARVDVVKRELKETLRSLPPGTAVNVIVFADQAYAWRRTLVELDEDQLRRLLRFVDRLRANGDTALYDALALAWEEPRADTLILLSDGEPSAGRFVRADDILDAVERLHAARPRTVHCISVNLVSALMEALTQRTGGTYREVF